MPQFTQIELSVYLTDRDAHSRECPFILAGVRDDTKCTCFEVYTFPASLYGPIPD